MRTGAYLFSIEIFFRDMAVFSKNVNYGSYDKNGRVKKLAVVRSSLEIGDSNSGGSLAPNA